MQNTNRVESVPMQALNSITFRTTTQFTLGETTRVVCPLCKTKIDASDTQAHTKTEMENSAVEVTLEGCCPTCHSTATLRLRLVAQAQQIDQLVWNAAKLAWAPAEHPKPAAASAFRWIDAGCIACACLIYLLLPDAYQSAFNLGGLLLAAFVASREVRKWA